MGKRLSDKAKIKRGMGTGSRENYSPWVSAREFNSQGTTSEITDWKTGRQVNCLSQGEALWYYILRWDDSNVDIREQYPLDVNMTVQIADALGFKHPQNSKHIMTTDFLVTKSDNSLHAYSVKSNRNLSNRTLQLLCIEKTYWNNKGCPYTILLKSDANKLLASNIRLAVEFYDASKVFDRYSAIKHKISIKEYSFDMEHIPITNDTLDKFLETMNG